MDVLLICDPLMYFRCFCVAYGLGSFFFFFFLNSLMIKCQHGSYPENRKSQLSRLLACLFFFSGFVFPALKLQVFSQSFALTGEDQLESSPLATVWVLRGETSVELFYTYATTRPVGAEFKTSCKTHFASELEAMAQPALKQC